MSFIQEGDHVIFKKEESSRVFHVRKNRKVHYEKAQFSVEDLIGEQYGCTFEVDRQKLVKVEATKTVELPTTDMDTSSSTADNRNLLDLESNQKMTKEEIQELKEKGITGEKIIEKLIENSETFKTKTEFSQAKFIKKKKNRHMKVFTVLRPTPRLVLECFAREPQKLCYLRPDSLSQLLNYSNVMMGSRVCVAESCQGMILACVLQRIGANGKLIHLVPNAVNSVCRQIMDYFSFSKEEMDCLYSYPMDQLNELDRIPTENKSENINEVHISTDVTGADEAQDVSVVGEKQASDASTNQSGDADSEKPEFVRNRDIQRKVRSERLKVASELITGKHLDSLIICCKFNPIPLLKKMLKFMLPSKPVVVFCQYIEPLKDCYTYIKDQQLGLQLRLTETWFRKYQVLPQRTHPEMNMSGTGGFLLTFMTKEAKT